MRRAVKTALLLALPAAAVLAPVSAGDAKNVVAAAAAAGSFKTFGKALAAADLVKTLEGEGPFTVFAPTDAAFAKLPKGDLDQLLKDKERLALVLKHHVITGKHLAKELKDVGTVKTLAAEDLDVSALKIVKADMPAANGVVLGIDQVLMPAAAKDKKEDAKEGNKEVDSLYALTTTTLEGKTFALSELKGKVTLVVNVASECGFTPQYAELQKLHAELSAKGFSVVGFPSNEFGGQEPGDAAAIRKFCDGKYHVTFPLASKVVTKPGKDQSPVYAFLTKGREAPSWNFCKYLVGKDGKVIQFYKSNTVPQDADLRKAIEAALK